jgi:hypothetical protein
MSTRLVPHVALLVGFSDASRKLPGSHVVVPVLVNVIDPENGWPVTMVAGTDCDE